MTSLDIIAIGGRVTARLAGERRRIIDAIRELQFAQRRPAPAGDASGVDMRTSRMRMSASAIIVLRRIGGRR